MSARVPWESQDESKLDWKRLLPRLYIVKQICGRPLKTGLQLGGASTLQIHLHIYVSVWFRGRRNSMVKWNVVLGGKIINLICALKKTRAHQVLFLSHIGNIFTETCSLWIEPVMVSTSCVNFIHGDALIFSIPKIKDAPPFTIPKIKDSQTHVKIACLGFVSPPVCL